MNAPSLVLQAHAKVNLYLAVGARRPDGYHDVSTVLHTVDLADTVSISPSDGFSFTCTPQVGVPAEANLGYRAATAMAERFGERLDVSVHIEKRIPAGAGLGGGSSDAAAVIRGLAARWAITDRSALAGLASTLGADVPFFLQGGAARFEGRGDVLVAALPSLDAPVVIVAPSGRVPTIEAYAAYDRLHAMAAPGVDAMVRALAGGNVRGVACALFNSMTPSSSGIVPAIREVIDLCEAHPGVLGAAMAGSGSAVFAICGNADEAASLADAAAGAGFWSAATRFSSGI